MDSAWHRAGVRHWISTKIAAAFTSLVGIVFLFQLSVDVFNNHKLLNIWATCVNVYAAYALWQIAKQKIIGPILAIVWAIATVFGGVVDLFPLHNDPNAGRALQKRSSQWVAADEYSTFRHFSDAHTADGIRFCSPGARSISLHTLRVDSGLQRSGPRSSVSTDISGDRPEQLKRLLRDNRIAYVAIDDGVRHNESLPDFNEFIFDQNFQKVFEDTEHAYETMWSSTKSCQKPDRERGQRSGEDDVG
jgi:hypothetical protein